MEALKHVNGKDYIVILKCNPKVHFVYAFKVENGILYYADPGTSHEKVKSIRVEDASKYFLDARIADIR